VECTQKAIEVDARCELAYAHLAQMYMSQGKLDEAIITYNRAVELSRTVSEMENGIMGLEAARAQMAAVDRLKRLDKQQTESQQQ
jgi:import receptor subunit TOM70